MKNESNLIKIEKLSFDNNDNKKIRYKPPIDGWYSFDNDKKVYFYKNGIYIEEKDITCDK